MQKDNGVNLNVTDILTWCLSFSNDSVIARLVNIDLNKMLIVYFIHMALLIANTANNHISLFGVWKYNEIGTKSFFPQSVFLWLRRTTKGSVVLWFSPAAHRSSSTEAEFDFQVTPVEPLTCADINLLQSHQVTARKHYLAALWVMRITVSDLWCSNSHSAALFILCTASFCFRYFPASLLTKVRVKLRERKKRDTEERKTQRGNWTLVDSLAGYFKQSTWTADWTDLLVSSYILMIKFFKNLHSHVWIIKHSVIKD